MPESEYQRGVTAGEIDTRLAGHDKHFARINGSIDKIEGHMESIHADLTVIHLAIQRLADGAINRDATVITTAAALKDAEQARRNNDTQRWQPKERFMAVMTLVILIASIIVTLILTRGGTP